jgi:cytochrome c oxidase cbb3-type subunit 4
MDMPTLRGVLTLILMLAFLGVVVWAWSSRRKQDFEAAARLPLDDADDWEEPAEAGESKS